MEKKLKNNFYSIQEKIETIFKEGKTLDIKSISDIERYVGMQKSIVESLKTLKGDIL